MKMYYSMTTTAKKNAFTCYFRLLVLLPVASLMDMTATRTTTCCCLGLSSSSWSYSSCRFSKRMKKSSSSSPLVTSTARSLSLLRSSSSRDKDASDAADDDDEEAPYYRRTLEHHSDGVRQPGQASYAKKKTSSSRVREARAFEKMMIGTTDTKWGWIRRRGRRSATPGHLILMRHGQSVGAAEQVFSGWSDPDLTDQGVKEVEHAARLIRESGYEIDAVFTSLLQRSIHSTWAVLRELDALYLPVFKSWRLNERSYGDVTQKSKADLARTFGEETVQEWRTDAAAKPPPMLRSDPRWPGKQRKYGHLKDKRSIPDTESLRDCARRVVPLWENKIKPELEVGHNVLVVGHGSTLRSLIQELQGLPDDRTWNIAIPPGSPIVYEFSHEMEIIPPSEDSNNYGLTGSYLEKPGLLQQALDREREWRKSVPGFDPANQESSSSPGAEESPSSSEGGGRRQRASRQDAAAPGMAAIGDRAMTSLERSLTVLQEERALEEKWATPEDGETDNNEETASTPNVRGAPVATAAAVSGDDNGGGGSSTAVVVHPTVIKGHPCLAPLPAGVTVPDDLQLPPRKNPVIVMIRHGKTEHNKLGLFTGWEDPPLAKEGVREAIDAGKLLKRNGFSFDVVYTSWLSRAIETSWYMLEQLDETWLPMIKSWRLNERMYGALTGKSKKMIARLYGDDQFYKWRRGYRVKPPAVDSFSVDYPGNDGRYQKFMTDLRWSVTETIIRTIGLRRWTPSRKLPKTESLHCCMKRTIPYLTRVIVPDSVDSGQRVLIASSENAIRGMLMHLCDIPADLIAQLNIPNGVPLVYDVKSKCIKLLDDGTGEDMVSKYNFGPAAEYLFRSRTATAESQSDSSGEQQQAAATATTTALAEEEACDIESLSEEVMQALTDLYSNADRELPVGTAEVKSKTTTTTTTASV